MGSDSCPWDAWEAGGTVEFCEARVCAWVVEPSNAWSNLAFIAVAAYLLWRIRGRLRTHLAMLPPAAALMGLCSFAFHASGTHWGEIIDDSAMYLIAAIFISLAMARRFEWSAGRTATTVALLTAASVIIRLNMTVLGIPFFAAQLVGFTGLEIGLLRSRGGDGRYLSAMALTFATAFGVWILDATGAVCDPGNHFVTGHAIWHLGTAVCLWLYYEYQEPFWPGASTGGGLPGRSEGQRSRVAAFAPRR